VKGIDMPEVEGMDMVEEQDHPTNHRLGEEGMNMVGSNMVEVDDIDTMGEHFHPMNHRPKVDGMDTVEEHFHPMNHRPEVEGMDTVDTDMGEDRAVKLRWLKESLRVWCWWGTGPAMEQWCITELIESGRSLWNRGVQKINPRLQLRTPIIVRYDIEYRRVKKRVKMWWKGVKWAQTMGRYLQGGGQNLNFLEKKFW
jgi:hypothetical protein